MCSVMKLFCEMNVLTWEMGNTYPKSGSALVWTSISPHLRQLASYPEEQLYL